MVIAFSLFCALSLPLPELRGPQMQIVSHEDDDLLFMNPTVQHAIDANRTVVSVYLTAGDAGMEGTYWHARESGIRAAYAVMAGKRNVWDTFTLRAGGALFDGYSLSTPAQVTVLFLHLPDGGEGVGSKLYHSESLRELWQQEITSIGTVDGRQRLSSEQLIEALVALLDLYQPADVSLLDCTGLNGWDHNDHFYSAMFGLKAFNRYNARIESRLSVHRGYNIRDMPANMSSDEEAAKAHAVTTYIPFDEVLCVKGRVRCGVNGLYALWLQREYVAHGTYVQDAQRCVGTGY